MSQRFDTSGGATHASKAAALSFRTLQPGNAFRDALRHPLNANAQWHDSQSVRYVTLLFNLTVILVITTVI
ncbi:DUF1534 domain-containing protein [Pseudomonas congelans]|nr:DUF1534 domain-containing protein [Pseudomonas congelans]QVX17242.1 DUF1534 domain-containing protein [Pseudomonas congelans]